MRTTFYPAPSEKDEHKSSLTGNPKTAELSQHGKTPNHSSASSHKDTILTRVANQINQEVNYESLTLQDIANEKELLKAKAREMNSTLAKLIEKEWQKRTEEERINKKAVIARQMGINSQQLNRQYIENTHKIKSMEDQFLENNQKLLSLTDPDSKVNLVRRIAECELKIKQTREQLGRIKKNKILREREIIKVNNGDRTEVSSLQIEYINLAKKSEFLISRSQKVQEELADCEFSLVKQKDLYEELKSECAEIQKTNITPVAQDHLKFLYDSHKKKLESQTKRNQRDEEVKKRKYYGLLLDFQRSKKIVETLEVKIYQNHEQIQRTTQHIQQLLEKFQNIKEEEKRRKNRAITSFMITEIPKERVALRTKNNITQGVDENPVNNQHQKLSMNGPIVRKWNSRVLGSIVRQPKIQHNVTEGCQVAEEVSSYFSMSRNRMKSSVIAGQIKRFQTQGSPSIDYQQGLSLANSRIEEAYPSDFDE